MDFGSYRTGASVIGGSGFGYLEGELPVVTGHGNPVLCASTPIADT